MHSAFNLLVFPNSMFTPLLFFYIERAMCSPEKLHLKITIIIIIIISYSAYNVPVYVQNANWTIMERTVH